MKTRDATYCYFCFSVGECILNVKILVYLCMRKFGDDNDTDTTERKVKVKTI